MFYGKLEPGDREQYLRRALGDDLYEWLDEVTMKELIFDDFAWRCPNCKARLDGGNVEFNHPQVECPRCKTISWVPAEIMTKTVDQAAEDGRGCDFSAKRDKSVAEICPNCNSVILGRVRKGDTIICKNCGLEYISELDYCFYCPDCELHYSPVDEEMPACPTCSRIDLDESESADNIKNKESDPNGLDAHDAGAKLDAGKPLGGLLAMFSRALKEVVRVGTFGAKKYTRGGWQHIENGIERYTDAMWRHLLEESINPIDTDSGMWHDAQIAWNALARLELRLRQTEDPEKEADKFDYALEA